MAVNIQTIKDIRNFLLIELHDLYPETEINSMSGIIIQNSCKADRMKQITHPDLSVGSSVAEYIKTICSELKTGKPIQYILGETEFYSCRIIVNSNVLIPRQETEELVDLIIKENNGYTGSIIDFCTGSGCISIALSINLPGSSVQATDISEEALKVAAANASLNNTKIELIHSDILGPVHPGLTKAGIIVSNPPYVRNSEKKLMHKNVLDFEPHSALFVSDDDPLIFYKALLSASFTLLDENGKIYFEINEALGGKIESLFKSFGFMDTRIFKDINGKDRIARGVKNG